MSLSKSHEISPVVVSRDVVSTTFSEVVMDSDVVAAVVPNWFSFVVDVSLLVDFATVDKTLSVDKNVFVVNVLPVDCF